MPESADAVVPCRRIVLAGGSAGSLHAFRAFVEALPARLAAAVVLIQHRSPDVPSQLGALAASWTSLPVCDLGDGDALEAGCIYVCPAACEPVFSGGGLVARVVAGERMRPIDEAARGLAAACGAAAALVVLSGTGHDGTAGARAVRAGGGLVLAQDAATASFDGMPRSVREAGLADGVGDPARLAEIVAAWAAGQAPQRRSALEARRDAQLDAVLDLLRQRLNRDFRDYKRPTLTRRVERRMGILGIADLDAYVQRLGDDPAELTQLGHDLLIGVTAFFRDRAAFEVLEHEALPALLAARSPGEPVRAWVAGCSSGEEAYSIGILLFEQMRQRGAGAVKIFATDLDGAALDVARAGSYSRAALAGVAPEWVERYFDERELGLRVRKELREAIVFARHNLVSDPPYSKLDLIVCRNVLIYLNRTMQRKVLSVFHFALNPGGVLFLGKAETPGNVERHFETVSKTWRVYRRTATKAGRMPELPMSTRGATVGAYAGDEPRLRSERWIDQGAIHARLLERHGTAQLLVDAKGQITYMTGDLSPYLRFPSGRPSRDLFEVVRADYVMALRLAMLDARRMRQRRVVNVRADGGEAASAAGVRIEVNPFESPERAWMLAVAFSGLAHDEAITMTPDANSSRWALEQLNQELQATRDDLTRTIEQARASGEEMRAANEEVLAMNEELQSTNEELESSKEELQSLNEELLTTNAALDAKIVEVEALNSDLRNLLEAALMPKVLLDRQCRVRRFTPACAQLMRISNADLGRALQDIVLLFEGAQLHADCMAVLAGDSVPVREISAGEQRWYLQRTLPYRNARDEIEGVVLTFADISQLKQSQHDIAERAQRLQWQADLLARAAPVIGRDLDDHIIFWNSGAEELYGWSEEQALGRVSHDLLQTRFPAALGTIREALVEAGSWRGELVHRTRDGKQIVVESRWTLYRPSGQQPQAIVEVNSNITQRKEMLAELKKSEAMLHTMIDWTYNLEYWIGPDGRPIYVSPSVERVTGYTADEVTANPGLLDLIVDPADAQAWAAHVQRFIHAQESGSSELNLRIVRRNGERRWVSHFCRAVFDDAGRYMGRRVTVRDITEQRRAEEQIRELAYYDPLTRLPNRRLLMDRLGQALVASERNGQYGAIVMLDLDHFKELNDTRGHESGDRLLVEVAARLCAAARVADTVARLGGDEFIVMVEELGRDLETAESEVAQIAEAIRARLAQAYDADGAEPFDVSASLGVTLFRGREVSAEVCIKQADIALYQAKDAGRNAVRYFSPAMQSAVEMRAALQSAIRRGLEHDEFMLFYQPQVDRDGAVVGAEALLRWQRADGSLVLPGTFIAAAEASGLIVDLGRWALREACMQLRAWSDDPATQARTMSVNISARQFYRHDFVAEVLRALHDTGADASRLRLELTEGALLERMDDAVATMRRLIANGVSFSLDDFGTGYSSLAYLKRLPVREVKIDRSFVEDMADDVNDRAIVRAVLAMAHALNLEVVAEGVEHDAQRALLLQAGCETFQGYLFGRPLPYAQWPTR